MLSILLLNFSRQAGDFCSNLVASSKLLVAMATKMVLTWRVVSVSGKSVGLKTLSPNIHTQILLTYSHIFSYSICSEKIPIGVLS